MIFIKDNDRFYFVESAYLSGDAGRLDQATLDGNMTVFKAKKSNVLIAGETHADLDSLRYLPLNFPAELSQSAILKTVMPKLMPIRKKFGRIDEDGAMPWVCFGKKDKAFLVNEEGLIVEIEDEMAYGYFDGRLFAGLNLTKGLPFKERIQKIYKAMGKTMGWNLFPLIVGDTKTCKISIVEENL